MPLSIDASGQLRLSFEFTLRQYRDFPGAAADAVRESRAAGHASCFAPPAKGEPSWHPAMALALACVDAGEIKPEHGCSDLRIAPTRRELESRADFSVWSVRCEMALNRPDVFFKAAHVAASIAWGSALHVETLEEAAYELLVASNTRDYSPADASIELAGLGEGASTLAMAQAWAEAFDLKASIAPASPFSGAPPRL